MTADLLLSEVVQTRALNAEEARSLVDSIKSDVLDLGERIATAYLGRSWIALGYPSWDALCDAEFDGARIRIPREQRAEQVQSLASQGLSTRAIGAALGVGATTVKRDLATGPDGPVDRPPVQSLDGRTRPATQPRPAPASVTRTETTEEQFLATRETGEVLSPEKWQAQQEQTAALDADLEAQIASTDDRFLLNLARALSACNGLLALSPERVAETCAPGSDDHAVLTGFITRMEQWIATARRPALRSVR